jgi:arsenate reductase
MSKFIIYHNPRCSKSREALEIIRQNNLDHQIKLYLEDPLTFKELESILLKLQMQPRELLRKGENDYKLNNLSDLKHSNQDIINFMIKFPRLIERPIIIKEEKAVLGRPPENVNHLF